MSHLKRPDRGETEEDLLKFQEEFLSLKNKNKQAEELCSSTSSSTSGSISQNYESNRKSGDKRKSKNNDINPEQSIDKEIPPKVPTYDTTKPKSRFRAGREPLYEVPGTGNEDILNSKDVQVSAFLSQIVERDTQNVIITPPTFSADAFPVACHRDASLKTGKKGNKLSLFGQQLEKCKQSSDIEMKDDTMFKSTNRKGIQPSRIVKGLGLSVSFAENEIKQIHKENTAKLAEMSEAEILEEQNKLLGSLDPKVLAFLKNSKEIKKEMAAPMDTSSKIPVTFSLNQNKVETDDINLPIKCEEDWVSMDNIEYGKLEWMKEVPPIKTGDMTGRQARFDLDGCFISADANVPVYKGLHHHGDEPERAGYTLEELFHLSRSSNIPQRILALNVLAKILLQAKQGLYVDCIQTAILPTMLEAGVIFLFRWALDDTSESVQMAAVNTLYCLLCNQADEIALNNIYYWYQGLVQPSLIALIEDIEEDEEEDEEEKAKESDDEMARRDLVLALINRMMILPRLKYLLMKKNLSAPTIVQVLLILTRMAQHSASAAYEIVHLPGLLNYIFSEFLPITWSPLESHQQINTVRGYPIPEALKLIAAICKAGKNMTAILISSQNLQDTIQRYIAVSAKDLQLPDALGDNLQKQSYIVWKMCLSYSQADELYLNLYSVFLERLISVDQTRLNNKSGAMLISSLESVLQVAAITNKPPSFNTQADMMDIDCNDGDKTDTMLDWSNIMGLYQPIIQCLIHQLQYIGDNYQFQKEDLEMVTCLMNFVVSFYYNADSQIGYNTIESLKTIETLSQDVLLPFWKSLGFRSILLTLSQYSNLLSVTLRHEEVSTSLPCYGASCLINKTSLPILNKSSPFAFVTAYLRLIASFCRLHKGMIEKIVPHIINDVDIINYIRKICQLKDSPLYSNYFTKFENIFQYQILKLCSIKESKKMSLMHRLSLHLLTRLQHGDEYLIHHLFSYVVFSPEFLLDMRNSEESIQSMADLQLTDVKALKSATLEEITLTTNQLLETARNEHKSIKTVYLTVFSGKEKACAKSRIRYTDNPSQTDNMLTSNVGETLLPQDWMFLPLVELYNKSSLAGSHFQDHMPAQNVGMVSNVLQWIFLLECERPEILRPVSISLKLSRIMCTFLAGNDLFLEKSVRSYLAALLREYTRPVLLQQIDFTRNIHGLISFFDLYTSLLEQYGAVSFGDSVFGSYILIPLQQQHSVNLRLSLWGEHHDALRSLIISVQELLLPVERFLKPDETDTGLIQLYFVHLTSKLIQAIRTPVPYLIAIHHTNRFLYYTQDKDNTKLRENMWNWVKAIEIDSLKNHLINYKKFNKDLEYCLELYTVLPSNRQQTYNDLYS